MNISRTSFVTFILLMVIGVFTACRDENMMKEEQLKLRSDMESTIAEVNSALQGIEMKMPPEGDATMDSLNVKIDRLKEVRENLQDKLDAMADISAGEWDAFQRSVEGSLDNAERTLEWVKSGKM